MPAGDPVFGAYGAGNVAGWISAAQREGMGYNEALRTFRDVGGSIGNDKWSSIWGQVRDVESRYPGVANTPVDQLPNAADYGTWSMGSGGKYATNVWATFTDIDTGAVMSKTFTYVTSDPHSPADAIEWGTDQFEQGITDSWQGQQLNGVSAGPPMLTVPYGP